MMNLCLKGDYGIVCTMAKLMWSVRFHIKKMMIFLV